MVEADLGKKAGFAAVYERKVRALILRSSEATTNVMLIGEETRYSQGANPSTYHIDSHAKSEGGKIWEKMVAVADELGKVGPAAAASPSPQQPSPTGPVAAT